MQPQEPSWTSLTQTTLSLASSRSLVPTWTPFTTDCLPPSQMSWTHKSCQTPTKSATKTWLSRWLKRSWTQSTRRLPSWLSRSSRRPSRESAWESRWKSSCPSIKRACEQSSALWVMQEVNHRPRRSSSSHPLAVASQNQATCRPRPMRPWAGLKLSIYVFTHLLTYFLITLEMFD